MFNSIVRILLKLFELIGCIACLITKNLTDQEARRIAVRNQKYSREWSLLNNVTWSREGNAFASVTYGGFTLITSLLLIARCINPSVRPTLIEKTFLTVGMIFFFTIGSLVYASIEQVPFDLHDNAIILGTLSFLVGILFLIDLADPMGHNSSSYTQTDQIGIYNQSSIQTQTSKHDFLTINPKNANNANNFNNSNNERIDITPIPSPDIQNLPLKNGYYFSGDQIDIVQTKMLPTKQEPIFAKILLPEKKRSTKETIVQPIRIYQQQQHHHQPFNSEDYHSKLPPSSTTEITDLHKQYNYNNHKRNHQILTNDIELDRPIRAGFVAQAARMWDRKAKRQNRHVDHPHHHHHHHHHHEFSTVV